MKELATIILLGLGFSTNASADVWTWVDANGDTHYVDTENTIYTWVDQDGKVYYSDKPEHEDAVAVALVWHSPGSLSDIEEAVNQEDEIGNAYPGETETERLTREMAEEYYCNRAREIYDTYAKAPQLYKTDENGERQYLSEEETAATLVETEARVAELCQ